MKTQCRTALKRARWLLAHYDLKAQAMAIEVTEYTQTVLNIGRRFIQIARVLFGQCPGRVFNGDIDYRRVSLISASRTVPLTVTVCCAPIEEYGPKNNVKTVVPREAL